MSTQARVSVPSRARWATALLLAGSLTACSAAGEPATPASPSAAETPLSDNDRFIIECVGVDGSAIGPFTRLEEAWASTNYTRIEQCEAHAATTSVKLTTQETEIARAASAAEDQLEVFLVILALCVREEPEALAALDEPFLRAALQLCPEAPHAALISSALEERTSR